MSMKNAIKEKLYELRAELKEVFDEFDTYVLTVTDFGILTGGDLLTHVALNIDGGIEYWSGNPDPDEDKDAAQLNLTDKEELEVVKQLLKNI